MSKLTDDYAKNTCKWGQRAATCRYLTMDANGWGCAKLVPDMRAYLDGRVERGTINARGDNCKGLPA